MGMPALRIIFCLLIIVLSAIVGTAQNGTPKCSDMRLRNAMRSIVRSSEFRSRTSDVDLKNQDCRKLFTTKFVDLNGDGVPEILMRGQVVNLCGGVGNCSFYVVTLKGRILMDTTDYVDRSIMGKQVQKSRTKGYSNILTTGHISAGETMFVLSRFDGHKYIDSKCPRYEVYDREINGKPHFKMIACKVYEEMRLN